LHKRIRVRILFIFLIKRINSAPVYRRYLLYTIIIPPLFSFIPFTSLYSVFFSLSRPSLTSPLKITSSSFYHSAPVVWNILPSDLCSLYIMSLILPTLKSSDVSTCLCLKMLKTSFTLPFLLSLYSPRLSQG